MKAAFYYKSRYEISLDIIEICDEAGCDVLWWEGGGGGVVLMLV